MAAVLKKSIKELDAVETDDFVAGVEAHAVDIEKNFVKIFSSEETHEFDQLRVKYLSSAAPLATFDFETN